jgi:hypothetical protein
MKKYWTALILLCAVLGLAAPASAVVLQGSTYSFYLEGSQSDNNAVLVAHFDGMAETGTRNGQLLTLTESETVLSATTSRISITLRSVGDLFPAANETAILAIGSEDALDIDGSSQAILTDARVTLFDLAGGVFLASDNLVDFATQPSPWDGTFPAPGSAFGIDEIGGMGIAGITFDFFVSFSPAVTPMPEPGSVLLCVLGMLALVAARRKATSIR